MNAGGVGGMRLAYQAATAAESEACAARFRAYDIDEARVSMQRVKVVGMG